MAQPRLRLLFAALAVVLAIAGAAAEPAFPPLTGRVVDQVGLFNAAAKARLEGKLADLEAKTTTQLVVVTLSSLQGYEIADYGYQLGRHWGIGQKGKNNGALLIVAPTDRKVRIEVGYGLEGLLTDAVTRLIIDNAILPRFRAGDFVGGIERGTDDIIQVLSGDAEAFKQRAAGRPSGGEGFGAFTFVLIFLAFWFFLVVRGVRKEFRRGRRGSGLWGPPLAGGGWSSGSSSGGGSWGGSGGGSSGGGGFSGGGGSFGGGGSSGSW